MGAPAGTEQAPIGAYSPVRRVAQSYFGSLWVALDRRGGGGGKPVLLRLLQLPSGTALEALQRMACAGRDAMALNHENVLPVLDVVQDHERLAFVYAYVDAEPLRSLTTLASLRKLSFPVPVSLRVAIDLCRGVKALHGTLFGWPSAPPFGGIAPDSVLIARDGRTRLCDPLIASCATLLEGVGLNAAKLAYAAPEQVHATGQLSPTMDVFACAAILWELLTGRPRLTGSRAAIERRLLEHGARSLSTQLPAEAGVSPRLVQLVERSLSSDPDERPPSPGELALELEQCGQEIAAHASVGTLIASLAGAGTGSWMSLPGAGARRSTHPSAIPSAFPVAMPSAAPSAMPSAMPVAMPSAAPAAMPVAMPSAAPAAMPTAPRAAPVAMPVAVPSAAPRAMPTAPRAMPVAVPSAAPRAMPTASRGVTASSKVECAPTLVQPELEPAVEHEATPKLEPTPTSVAPKLEAAPTSVAPSATMLSTVPAPRSSASGTFGSRRIVPLPARTGVASSALGGVARERKAASPGLTVPRAERKPAPQDPIPSPEREAPLPSGAHVGAPRPKMPTIAGLGLPPSLQTPPLAPEPPSAAPPVPRSERPIAETSGPTVPPRAAASSAPTAVTDELFVGFRTSRAPARVWSSPPSAPSQPPPRAPAADTDQLAATTRSLRPAPESEDLTFPSGSGAAGPSLHDASGWSRPPPPPSNRRSSARAARGGIAAVLALSLTAGAVLLWRQDGDEPRETAAAAATRTPSRVDTVPAQPIARAEPAPEPAARPATLDAGAAARDAKDATQAASNGTPQAPSERVHGIELDDARLLELFALESRSGQPRCKERTRRQRGKNAPASRAQLEAAKKALARGDQERARGSLCAALAHQTTNVAAWQSLAELMLELGDPVQAKRAAERGLSYRPRDRDLLGLVGDASAMLGKLDEGRAYWLRSVPGRGTLEQRRARAATLFASAGDRLLRAGSHAAALAHYRRAVVLGAGARVSSLGMAEALSRLEQKRAARAWSDRNAQVFPAEPSTAAGQQRKLP